jgi:hypothetical protein
MKWRFDMQKTEQKINMLATEEGAIGWALLWLLGIPLPILLVLFLLAGYC